MGPKASFAVPDVTAVTLQRGEYGRFILASVGVWDVLSEQDVISLVENERSALRAAKLIARVTFQTRISWGSRGDDISVCVVDVNRLHHPSLLDDCLTGGCVVS